MENKTATKKLPNAGNHIGLLPNYFKKIGLAIIILALVSPLIFKASNVEWEVSQREILRMLSFNMLIIGLLLIALARDVMEDEKSVLTRLRTMAIVFIQAVLYVIIRPLVDLAFSDPITDISGQELLFYILFLYHIFYFIQKKKYAVFEMKKRK